MARNPHPDVTAAIAARRNLSTQKIETVRETLLALAAEYDAGGPRITKSLICKRADVSKAFLYTHPDLLAQVDEQINKHGGGRPANAREYSDATQIALIKALTAQVEKQKRDNKVLQEANDEMEQQMGMLFGKIDRLISEKQKLQQEIDALKRIKHETA